MSIELTRAICTTCGSSIEVDQQRKTGLCHACGNTFVVNHAIELTKVEVDKTKELENARKLLKIAVLNDDIDAIITFSNQIREVIPNDYQANYYYGYASKKNHNPKHLKKFYQTYTIEATPKALEDVINHIIELSDLRDYNLIKNYLSYVNTQAIERYESVFKQRKILEDNYSFIPRDIFICHRSTDGEIASNVVKTLEEDGNICWISSRNLRPNDNENYWKNIEEAIDTCNLFLVVSSQDAMLSKDVQRELDIAQKKAKTRIEFKIDQSDHTMYFKYFFDGIKWIDGFTNIEQGFKELRKRVFDLLVRIKEKQRPDDQKDTKENVQIENYIKRAEVELEHGNDQKAIEYIEKALDMNVEYPQAWWVKFLIRHHFKNTQAFMDYINDEERLANALEVMDSNEYKTSKKFTEDLVFFRSHEEIIERHIQHEINNIIEYRSEKRLDALYEHCQYHPDLIWLNLLFSFHIYDPTSLEEMLTNKSNIMFFDYLFSSEQYQEAIKNLDYDTKYTHYETTFNDFKKEIGEELVNSIYKTHERVQKIIKKIKKFITKKRYKKAYKKAKKIYNYGATAREEYHYYMLLSTFEIQDFDDLQEQIKQKNHLKKFRKLIKHPSYIALKDKGAYQDKLFNIDEKLKETENQIKHDIFNKKHTIRKIRFRKLTKFFNFLVFLTSFTFIILYFVFEHPLDIGFVGPALYLLLIYGFILVYYKERACIKEKEPEKRCFKVHLHHILVIALLPFLIVSLYRAIYMYTYIPEVSLGFYHITFMLFYSYLHKSKSFLPINFRKLRFRIIFLPALLAILIYYLQINEIV